jgi:hypothetical protein
VREWPEIEEMLRRCEVKWILREIAILLISVFILVPLLLVIAACAPFAAMWAMLCDRDLREEVSGDRRIWK